MKKSAVRAAVEAAEERGEARVQSCHKEMWNFYLVLTTLSLEPCRMPSGSRRARLV